MWRGRVAARGLSSEGSRPWRMRFRGGPFAGGQGHGNANGRRSRRDQPGAFGRPQGRLRHDGDAAIHRLYGLARGRGRRLEVRMMRRGLVTGRRGSEVAPGVRRRRADHQHREGAEQHHQGLDRTHPAQLGADAAGFKPGRRSGPGRARRAARPRARDRAASASHPANARISSPPGGRRRRRGSRATDAGLWRRRWCRCR